MRERERCTLDLLLLTFRANEQSAVRPIHCTHCIRDTPRERRDLLCTYHQVRGPVRIKVKIRCTFLEIDLGDVGAVLNREVVGETDAAWQPSNAMASSEVRTSAEAGESSRLHRERSLFINVYWPFAYHTGLGDGVVAFRYVIASFESSFRIRPGVMLGIG